MMPYPFDLEALRCLIAVADTGSFSHAGQRIGRSQSAVSMQIKKLEALAGKALLIRGGSRKVIPSPTGADLIAYGRRMLRLSEEAWACLRHPDISGTVRLGSPEDYSASLLPPILEAFSTAFPRVTVELVCEPTTELTALIRQDRLDLAIITRLADQPIEILRKEPMVWVASPHHTVWETTPLPVALFQTCGARANILKALTETERCYHCTYSSSSMTGMVTIVQAGLAVAGLARCSVPPSLRIIGTNEGLPPLQELEIGLLRNPRQDSPAIQQLLTIIRQQLG